MTSPVLIICELVREMPEARVASERRFCACCRSRVWVSKEVLATAKRDQPESKAHCACPACARAMLIEAETPPEYVPPSAAQLDEAVSALGATREELLAITLAVHEELVAAWRAHHGA